MDTQLEMDGKMMPARVQFDAKGREEFRKFGQYGSLILDVLPFVTDVIDSGEYAGRRIQENHYPQEAFHTKIKKVSTPNGEKWVAVDIGEDVKGKMHAYSVNTEGIPSFPIKKRYFDRMQKKKIGLDSVLLPSSKDSVRFFTGHSHQANENSLPGDAAPVKLEVIRIRILD